MQVRNHMSRYNYKFEVEASINDDIGAVEVDSLDSAIKKLTSNGVIYAICHYPFGDGRPMREVIKLRYKNVNQHNEKDIYEFLDNEVDRKRFQK